jgi:threonine/homoserine/homoserine lactone efflux protein
MPETSSTAIATEETFSHSFKKGFISNILNVQTTFVFLSIFPHYMNKQSSLFIQSFLLTGIFIGLLFAWYALLIFLIALVRERLLHPNIQLSIKAITGLLLFGMGCKMFLR